MGVALRLLPLGLLLLAATGHAKDKASFTREVAGGEIDWSAGTITAPGAAAADMRMPSPNAARPGAERRARAAAEEKLRVVLRSITQDKRVDVEAAVKRAAVVRTEYQSDGGVFLWLGLRFADVAPGKETPRVLKLASAPFEFAPTLVAAGHSVQLSFATYRPLSECPKDAISVTRDSQGRLELPAADARLVDSFAGTAVVIYLDRAQP